LHALSVCLVVFFKLHASSNFGQISQFNTLNYPKFNAESKTIYRIQFAFHVQKIFKF